MPPPLASSVAGPVRRFVVDAYHHIDTGGPEALVQLALSLSSLCPNSTYLSLRPVNPRLAAEYPALRTLPMVRNDRLRRGDVYIIPETVSCDASLAGRGVRSFVFMLSAKARRRNWQVHTCTHAHRTHTARIPHALLAHCTRLPYARTPHAHRTDTARIPHTYRTHTAYTPHAPHTHRAHCTHTARTPHAHCARQPANWQSLRLGCRLLSHNFWGADHTNAGLDLPREMVVRPYTSPSNYSPRHLLRMSHYLVLTAHQVHLAFHQGAV